MVLEWLGAGFTAWRGFETLCVRRRLLSRFAAAGRGVTIGRDVRVFAPERIRVGDGVAIGDRVVLRALTCYPWCDPPQTFEPRIDIGRGCFLNNDTQISCVRRVTIGDEVMIAERCFIADNNHGYSDVERSIRAQPLAAPGEVSIGEGSWIGVNACIVGNVRIGRHCVVGANSVVTHDLPDFCVVAGAPAKAIKRYDPNSGTWVVPRE